MCLIYIVFMLIVCILFTNNRQYLLFSLFDKGWDEGCSAPRYQRGVCGGCGGPTRARGTRAQARRTSREWQVTGLNRTWVYGTRVNLTWVKGSRTNLTWVNGTHLKLMWEANKLHPLWVNRNVSINHGSRVKLRIELIWWVSGKKAFCINSLASF